MIAILVDSVLPVAINLNFHTSSTNLEKNSFRERKRKKKLLQIVMLMAFSPVVVDATEEDEAVDQSHQSIPIKSLENSPACTRMSVAQKYSEMPI